MSRDEPLTVDLSIRQGIKSLTLTTEELPLAEALDVIRAFMAEIMETDMIKVVD